jgi:hypothetical protein
MTTVRFGIPLLICNDAGGDFHLMSRVHTKLPSDKQYGEYLVSQFLASVADDGLELWFNLDPNGIGEIDVVLAHPQLGSS